MSTFIYALCYSLIFRQKGNVSKDYTPLITHNIGGVRKSIFIWAIENQSKKHNEHESKVRNLRYR